MNSTGTNHHRGLSASLWFVGAVAVGAGGFGLQQAIQPPLVNYMGLAPFRPLFFCGLASLAIALYLFGFVLSGHRSPWWHVVVFVFVGACAGFLDGVYFAWLFGSAIGMVSGGAVGVLVFVVRRLTVRGA